MHNNPSKIVIGVGGLSVAERLRVMRRMGYLKKALTSLGSGVMMLFGISACVAFAFEAPSLYAALALGIPLPLACIMMYRVSDLPNIVKVFSFFRRANDTEQFKIRALSRLHPDLTEAIDQLDTRGKHLAKIDLELALDAAKGLKVPAPIVDMTMRSAVPA